MGKVNWRINGFWSRVFKRKVLEREAKGNRERRTASQSQIGIRKLLPNRQHTWRKRSGSIVVVACVYRDSITRYIAIYSNSGSGESGDNGDENPLRYPVWPECTVGLDSGDKR